MRERLLLLLLGTVLALTFVELALRGAGQAFLWRQRWRNQLSLQRDGSYRILCIGESTTAVGAYTRQLERILNERAKGDRFSVINRGRPGAWTDAILQQLPDDLDRYHPHVVVAMMGVNDELDWFLLAGGVDDGGGAAEPATWLRAVSSLRTYKLLGLGWLSLCEKIARLRGAPDPMARGQVPEIPPPREEAVRSLPVLHRAVRAHPRDEHPYLELARAYVALTKPRTAEVVLRKGTRAAHSSLAIRRELGVLYFRQHRYDDARKVLQDASLSDGDQESVRQDIYSMRVALAVLLVRGGRLTEAEPELNSLVASLPPDATTDRATVLGALATVYAMRGDQATARDYRRRADAERPGVHNPQTRENYLEVLRLLRARGIRLVAVQYPLRSVDSLKGMLGAPSDVVFVENQRLFETALRHAPYSRYFRDTFAGDFGHMTREGSYLLAANVARAILHELPHR